MSTAKITVLITEESVLDQHAFVSGSGEPHGWLGVGERGELALFGSAGALRRLSVAAHDAAQKAERLPTYPHADHGRPAAA